MADPKIQKAVQRALQKEIEKRVASDFLIFLLEKWHISSGEHAGEPFQLVDTPYLIELAIDTHPFQIILKAAQARISEIKIAKCIWGTIFKKSNALYTMPAGEQMQQFVDSRVRAAILNSEFLSQYVTGSLNLKKISLANRQIYFRGVQKRRQIITVDVSRLFADEADEYETGTLYTLNKRLGAAKNPERDYFSTPSFHGTGVSLYYYGSESQGERGSDQRVWCIRCEHCGQWNEDLEWPANLVDLNINDIRSTYYRPNVIVICRFCHTGIDRLAVGEWVAKFPSNGDYCHGRHVSKLFSPTADLNQMMLDSRDPIKEQEFYNSDLGLPYEPKGTKLTDEVIDRCRGNHLILIKSPDTWNCLGVDIGLKVHCLVTTRDQNNKLKILAPIELDDWEDLTYVQHDFNIKCTVVDANPDKEEAIDFQKGFDNVWLAYYMQHLEKTKDTISINWDDQIVHIHRTLMMSIVLEMFNERNVILPMDIARVRDFYEHLKSPVKALKQDVKGDWIPFYPKTRIADHYFHTVLYSLAAWMLKPEPAIFRIAKVI